MEHRENDKFCFKIGKNAIESKFSTNNKYGD